MEMEYRDPSKKGRWIVLLGVVLAVVAGGAAFYLLNNAQQQAGASGLKTISGYVAARPILAGKAIVPEDLQLRTDIPLDNTNAAVITTDGELLGRLLAVDVAQGQLLTANLLSSGTVGLGFKILEPTESVAPESEAWRAVSVTVEDARAVGGVLGPNMTVDVFVTASVTVPEEPPVLPAGPGATPLPAVSALDGFMSGRTTKITYQGMRILARAGTNYILKVPLVVAEEISHMQAEGSVQFSLALRPDQDTRYLDVSALGATNNRIIQRYGLPVPQPWPTLGGPRPSVPPIPEVTPPPSPTPPPAAPGASAVPSAPPAAPSPSPVD